MPKFVTQKSAKILTDLDEQAKWTYNIAVRKARNCPNLPTWMAEKSVEHYLGALGAIYGAIETILRIDNAYRGFSYVWGEDIPVQEGMEELRNYHWVTREKK